MKQPTTVDEYIAAAPPEARPMLKELRRSIRATCPKAEEMISYRMPFYQYQKAGYVGRMIYFAAFAHHVGVYVVPRSLPPAVAKHVERYKTAKATLRFPFGTKIPTALIRQLVRIRMKEIDAVVKK